MSRYSPTVRPYEGPDIGQALVQAFMAHRQAKRERVLEDRQDQQYQQSQEEYAYRKSQRGHAEAAAADADAVREAQMHDAGFRRADEVEHVAQAPAPVTGALVRDLGGQAVQPVDPRYERYGGGLYRDPNETPLARELRKQQAVFSQVQQADPKDYPNFVPGMDYTKELGNVLSANRTRERDQAQAKERRSLEEYRQGEETKREAARQRSIGARARERGSGGSGRGPAGLTRNEALSQARQLLTRQDANGTTTPDAKAVRDLADEMYEGRRAPSLRGGEGEMTPMGGGAYLAPPVRAAAPPDHAQGASAAQQAWDRLAAQYGKEHTVREIGPRPE